MSVTHHVRHTPRGPMQGGLLAVLSAIRCSHAHTLFPGICTQLFYFQVHTRVCFVHMYSAAPRAYNQVSKLSGAGARSHDNSAPRCLRTQSLQCLHGKRSGFFHVVTYCMGGVLRSFNLTATNWSRFSGYVWTFIHYLLGGQYSKRT